MKQIGIHGSMKDVMLDLVFGKIARVEAENKLDLKEKMKNAVTLLSEIKQQCLSAVTSRWKWEICYIYQKSRENSFEEDH